MCTMGINVVIIIVGIFAIIQSKATTTHHQEPCPVGTWVYVHSETLTCVPCEVGTYSQRMNAARCSYCPTGRTTFQSGTARSESCVERCLPGSGYRSLSGSCEPCPVGQYNSGQGANVNMCKLCPSAWTSREPGATVCDVNTPQEVPIVRTNLSIVLLYKLNTGSCDGVISDVITRKLRALLAKQSKTRFNGNDRFCYEQCANLRFVHTKCETSYNRVPKGLTGHVQVEFQIFNTSLYVQDTRDNSYLSVVEVIGQTLIASGVTDLNSQISRFVCRYVDFCQIGNQSNTKSSCEDGLSRGSVLSTGGAVAVGVSILFILAVIGIVLYLTLRSLFKRRLEMVLRRLDTIDGSQCLLETGQEMKMVCSRIQCDKTGPDTELK